MATHSSVLAWRIPGTGEPGGAAIYGVAQSRTASVRSWHLSKDLKEVKVLAPQKLWKSFPGRELTRCKLQTGAAQRREASVADQTWGSAQRWEASVAGQTRALPSAQRPVWLGQSNSAASYVDHCQQNQNLLLNEMSFDQRNKILF